MFKIDNYMFKQWLINEIKTEPHMPYIYQAMEDLSNLEKKIHAGLHILKLASKIERSHNRDYLRDILHFPYNIPIKTSDYGDKRYSQQIKDAVEYADIVKTWSKNVKDAFERLYVSNKIDYKPILKFLGTEYEGEKGTYIDNLINNVATDGSAFSGQFEDKDLKGLSQAQSVEILRKAKVLVQTIYKYYKEIEKFEEKIKLSVDSKDRKVDKYWGRKEGDKGFSDIPPNYKNIETLFHATPYLKEIQSQGFKLDTEKALGGNTEDAISFTADFNVAKAIVKSLREAIAIAKGQMSPEKIIIKMKSEGMDLNDNQAYKDYMRAKALNKKDDINHAWNLFKYYLALSKKRYDPLFFAVYPENFVNLDPRNVGVVASKVDMTKIKNYLQSMEEYRVPLDAILSSKIIRV